MMEVATASMGAPEGQGASKALLAHCFMGHSGSWKRLLGVMETPLEALAFDLPGHGRSPLPEVLGDYHGEVARAAAGLIREPRVLIGHSFGAAALLRMALDNPQLCAALVLIEPVFFAVASGDPVFAQYLIDEAPMRRAMAAGELERAAALFLRINADPRPWEAVPEALKAQMRAQIPMIHAAEAGLMRDSGGLCAPGRMEAFTPPVLILNGSESPLMFRRVPVALAARLPDAEALLIEGAGHMLPLTHPREVAARIDSFLGAKLPR